MRAQVNQQHRGGGGGLYNGQQYQQQVGKQDQGVWPLCHGQSSYNQRSMHHQDDQYGQPNLIQERDAIATKPRSRVIRSIIEHIIGPAARYPESP